jgi:hypothetical protein
MKSKHSTLALDSIAIPHRIDGDILFSAAYPLSPKSKVAIDQSRIVISIKHPRLS